MYDVVVTDEFAGWFEALPDAEAEPVAALLGVVGALGPALSPPRARRSLLWYDGVGSDAAGAGAVWREHWRYRVEALEAFDGWRREALRCLESGAFSQLLARLGEREAAAVLQAVDDLRQRLHAVRWATYPVGLHAHRSEPVSLPAQLKASFEKVMREVGLDPAGLHEEAGGLREATVAELAPPARIIYGLDLAVRRVVVLVADRLDHAYHGDSVRFAEAWFRDYLGGRHGIRPLHVARGA